TTVDYPNKNTVLVKDIDKTKITVKTPSGWSATVESFAEKTKTSITVTLKVSKGTKTYTITKELTGFKENTTSEVELTEQQVKDQTTVDYPNKNTVLVKDIDKTKITVKTPSGWSATVESFAEKTKTSITITLKVSKGTKTYTITKELEGFKEESATPPVIESKDLVSSSTLIGYKNKENTLVADISLDNFEVISKRDGWDTKVKSWVKKTDSSITVTIEAKKATTTYEFEHDLEGFKTPPSAEEHQQRILADVIVELWDDVKKEQVTQDKYKDYYSDFPFKLVVKSKSNKNKYEVEDNGKDPEKGTLGLLIYEQDLSGTRTGFSAEMKLTGFKKQLPEDKNDAVITIKGLSASQYSTRSARSIKEEDVEINSKSGKYKYQILGLEANMPGTLKVNVNQFNASDNTRIGYFSIEITGFKKQFPKDKNDVKVQWRDKEISENSKEENEKIYLEEIQLSGEPLRSISKSGDYDYEFKETAYDHDSGIITIKLNQKAYGKELGEITVQIQNLKRGQPSKWTADEVKNKITVDYENDKTSNSATAAIQKPENFKVKISDVVIEEVNKELVADETTKSVKVKLTLKLKYRPTVKWEVEITIDGFV
ncbi:lipoprotein 17-related variable surface protein, partial [Mycoplasma enhydrae]|uniref:lipoprotein 17-related variable surface protein n=1 Tax=Mycoplasma enhydrae TaxID=2499220 RepID=UPI0021E93FBE